MTNKEAIKTIQSNYPTSGYIMLKEALDMAIAALEKQEAKPPEHKVHDKYPTLGKNYYCGCGVMFSDFEWNGTNYCGNCGQKLKEEHENLFDVVDETEVLGKPLSEPKALTVEA